MITVKHDDPEQFVEEIKHHMGRIHANIVRVIGEVCEIEGEEESDKSHIFLKAGFIIKTSDYSEPNELHELEMYVGDDTDDGDNEGTANCESVCESLVKQLAELDIDVRGGWYG